MKYSKMLVFTFSFLTMLTVQAKTKTAVQLIPAKVDEFTLSDETYTSLVEQMKKEGSSRQPTGVVDRVNIDSMYAPDFLELKSDFEKISSNKKVSAEIDQDLANQLDRVLVKWGTKTNLTDQTKWVVAQLRIIKSLRGIAVRTRPLFERFDYQLPHTFIITFMRSIFAGVDAFLPTQQWRAGMAYISVPFSGMGGDIRNEQELRQFLNSEIIPTLNHTNRELLSILFTADHKFRPEFKPFYFDNDLLYTSSSFVSDNDRHVLIGKAEVLGLLSASSFALGSSFVALSYSWDGLLSTMSKLGLAYGMGAFSDPASMTAKKRIGILKASPHLLTILPTGAGTMKTAYVFVRSGLQFSKAAWSFAANDHDSYRDMPLAGSVPLLDPRALAPFNRILNAGYMNVDQLIRDKGITSALINGETVPVNFSQLFNNPPGNLRDFLPTKFVGDEDGDRPTYSLNVDGVSKSYRNYRYGNPVAWNYSAYTRYFPSATSATGVRKANQIMAQAWGGFIMAIPLSMNQF